MPLGSTPLPHMQRPPARLCVVPHNAALGPHVNIHRATTPSHRSQLAQSVTTMHPYGCCACWLPCCMPALPCSGLRPHTGPWCCNSRLHYGCRPQPSGGQHMVNCLPSNINSCNMQSLTLLCQHWHSAAPGACTHLQTVPQCVCWLCANLDPLFGTLLPTWVCSVCLCLPAAGAGTCHSLAMLYAHPPLML